MSLLSEAMETFNYMDKTRQQDGYGGVITVWGDGAAFQASAVLDNSMEARRAEKDGVTSVYTIVTDKSITLLYGDVIRRWSDKKLFRITADATDKKTPQSAGLNMRAVAAEELDALPQ